MDQYNSNNLHSAIFSDHAALQIDRREISLEDIKSVLANPYSIQPLTDNRVVVQGLISSVIVNKSFLLRIFVDIDSDPPVIVTAYKTSKLEKYGVRDERDIRFQD